MKTNMLDLKVSSGTYLNMWQTIKKLKRGLLSTYACLFLLYTSHLNADLDLSSVKRFQTINAIELKLDNGMTICLKPTKNDSQDVQIKFGALGGYGAIKDSDMISARMAATAALESGYGNMTSDQFSVYLYKNSIEFEPEVLPFSRLIEGEAMPETIEFFFNCVRMLFTEKRFSKEGFEAALKEMNITLNREAHDFDHIFESKFLQFNTQSLQALSPITASDLKKADFDVAKEFFHRCFMNPAEFVCIVVGNFDERQVLLSAKKYLGVIPSSKASSNLYMPISAPFPPGISKESIILGKQVSSLSKLTFPLQVKIEESNIQKISFISQIIEARLKKMITEKYKHSYGIDVSYEFPVYPYLNNPWISIRFRCDKADCQKIKDNLLQELARLLKNGVSSKEIDSVKTLELGSQEFWQNDDQYWVSMLLNYYMWGWNPEGIDYRNSAIKNLSEEQINQFLKASISLENFSEFIALPE